MLTRRALAGVAHPTITPCRDLGTKTSAHSWDLAEEGGVLYLYCIKCQETHKLDKERAIVKELPIIF